MDEVRLGSSILQPRRQLLVGGERSPLGKRALDILSVLAEARGEIVTKDELLEAVWPGVTVEENALQVHIVALRKALGPEADRLRTIRGVGYQLKVDRTSGVFAGEAKAPPWRTHHSLLPQVPALTAAVVWAKARAHRWALAVAALLLLLAGGWAMFGDELGLRPQQRIPVVVRELTATTNGDRAEAALASGITDELIIRLQRIADLRVATRGPDGAVPGDAFGKAHVVDGSIRRTGDQVRVTARLSSASGEVLWSQTFDRPLTDLLNVQEAIAAAIADALSVSLDVGTNATEYGGTDNPEAFAAFLQARATALDVDQDVPTRYLERALALDPNYVRALNSLSFSYGIRASRAQSGGEALSWLSKMDESTSRAVRVNPDLSYSRIARAIYFSFRGDWRSAAREEQRVAELDDGTDPELRAGRAGGLAQLGRMREAFALFDSAEIIDPITRTDPSRIIALANAGKYREAIDLFNRLEATNSGGPGFEWWVYQSYLALGDEAEARRFAEKHLPYLADDLRAFDAVEASLPTMSRAELRRWVTEQYGDGGNVGVSGAAVFASYRGHPKLAVELLRLASERIGAIWYITLWTPLMANTRKTDEFEQLVTDRGLVEVWRETGKWPDACRPVSQAEISCS